MKGVNSTVNPKPFVKWAGGKRAILPKLMSLLPDQIYTGEIDQYIEPFVGGGALFFALKNRNFKNLKYILNDNNHNLILTYKIIRDKLDDLIEELCSIENKYISLSTKRKEDNFYQNRDHFNSLRKESNIDQIKMASLFIFLNKTCYNGLYRSNRNGDFNVPFGDNPNPLICDIKNLTLVNKSLQSVQLTDYDFRSFFKSNINNLKKSLFYIDPPYVIQNGHNGFTSYNGMDFSWKEQEELAQIVRDLIKHESKIMISNAKHRDIILLYSKMNLIQIRVSRTNLIGGEGASREKIQEYVFTSYKNNTIFDRRN